jgi:hypothetical protein
MYCIIVQPVLSRIPVSAVPLGTERSALSLGGQRRRVFVMYYCIVYCFEPLIRIGILGCTVRAAVEDGISHPAPSRRFRFSI